MYFWRWRLYSNLASDYYRTNEIVYFIFLHINPLVATSSIAVKTRVQLRPDSLEYQYHGGNQYCERFEFFR